jgi:hypothetical protein
VYIARERKRDFTWKENTRGTLAGRVMPLAMDKERVPVSLVQDPNGDRMFPCFSETGNEVAVCVWKLTRPEMEMLVVIDPSTLERSRLLLKHCLVTLYLRVNRNLRALVNGFALHWVHWDGPYLTNVTVKVCKPPMLLMAPFCPIEATEKSFLATPMDAAWISLPPAHPTGAIDATLPSIWQERWVVDQC